MDPLQSRLTNHPLADLLRTVSHEAFRLSVEAYVVGGFVRDLILDRDTTDVDFVTLGEGSGARLASAVARATGGHTIHIYETFGTAAIRIPVSDSTAVFEFVAARRESYRKDSRNPVVEVATRDEDLERRDFTVNAMALDLHPDRFGRLVDVFGGVQDLIDGLLRTPLDPDRTFDDDPLRMVRAARFSAQLQFSIDEAALDAMRRQADRITIVSIERVTEELQKIMSTSRPSLGLRPLEETGILRHILPELSALRGVEAVDGHKHKDNFYHTLQVVDNLVDAVYDRPAPETLWLRWAALLHDIGKPRTKRFIQGTGWTFHAHEEIGARMVRKVFERLRLPTDHRVEEVEHLIRLHHRPVALVDDSVTDSAVRRLVFDAGDAIDDLMRLVRADITSKNPAKVRRYLGAFDRVDEKIVEVEAKDRLRHFQPPVDGHEIMQVLGIGEGLAVGIVKTAIREAILEGEIPNEHDPAFDYMMRIKEDALRRGRLYNEVVRRLRDPEKRSSGPIPVGPIKEAVTTAVLPDDDEIAVRWLLRVREPLDERET